VSVLLIIGAMSLVGLVAIIMLVRMHIEESEKTGILRDWGPGALLRKPITRDREPRLFAEGIQWLRAVPWVAAAVLSVAVLLIGLLL